MDQERLREFECLFSDGHLSFLHRFEEGRLYLGRRTVDFIRKYEIGEDWAFVHFELFVLLRVYECSQTSAGRRSGVNWILLNLALTACANCVYSQCFSKSRDAFEENMAVSEEAYEQVLHQLFLSDN